MITKHIDIKEPTIIIPTSDNKTIMLDKINNNKAMIIEVIKNNKKFKESNPDLLPISKILDNLFIRRPEELSNKLDKLLNIYAPNNELVKTIVKEVVATLADNKSETADLKFIHNSYDLIDRDGVVYSFLRIPLRENISRDGYFFIMHHNRDMNTTKGNKTTATPIDVLVATTYIPNTESGKYVLHIDRDKLNNNVDNLEWTDTIPDRYLYEEDKVYRDVIEILKGGVLEGFEEAIKIKREIEEKKEIETKENYRKFVQFYEASKVKYKDVYLEGTEGLLNHLTPGDKALILKLVRDLRIAYPRVVTDGVLASYRPLLTCSIEVALSAVNEMIQWYSKNTPKGFSRSDVWEIVNEEGFYLGFNRKIKDYHYNTKGYINIKANSIDGSRNTKGVHILVAKAFIPNPFNKPQVNHIDGNKVNNHISNLEWVTNAENMEHAVANGLINNNGEANSGTNLNNVDIEVMRAADRYVKDYIRDELTTKYRIDNNTYDYLMEHPKEKLSIPKFDMLLPARGRDKVTYGYRVCAMKNVEIQIRSEYKMKYYRFKLILTEVYGCLDETVREILMRHTWNHVEDMDDLTYTRLIKELNNK